MVLVGGAQEPGGVVDLGDVHGVTVDAVTLQPGAVVGEVRADRADQDGPQPQAAHAEGDVCRAAATADLQVVHQERQGHPVELLGDELVAEAPGEGHQVVGRDGAGDGDAHGAVLLVVGIWKQGRRASQEYATARAREGPAG
ncbi:hypothetical protein GCM10017559_36530 [Streptosporangium longisporum]|uniref:Uncharacterized protein n=1 Tax=Streptosporangium longisporum TaxID=46187 RepID=A0ABP6KH92_9ACTN